MIKVMSRCQLLKIAKLVSEVTVLNTPIASTSTSDNNVVANKRRKKTPTNQSPDSKFTFHEVKDKANYKPKEITFAGQPRIKVCMSDNPKCIDFFNLYITDGVLELIKTETNRYANENCDDWEIVDISEIRTFLGLLFLIAITYMPRIDMYWSKDHLYYSPIFGEIMTRNRFKRILRFLHFCDNSESPDVNDPNRDRLFKCRQILDLIRNNCLKVYEPGPWLCVDESLVLFKGRLAFKQYIRTKRAKFGIKFYKLCTHDGILLNFIVYTGANYLPNLHTKYCK